MSGQISWEKGEGDYFFGWTKLQRVVSPAFCIIRHPGEWGWNGCRLLYNDCAKTTTAELKYLQGTGTQSCKLKAGVMVELMLNGTVDLARLNWCRRYTATGNAFWQEMPLEQWIADVSESHPAFRERG